MAAPMLPSSILFLLAAASSLLPLLLHLKHRQHSILHARESRRCAFAIDAAFTRSLAATRERGGGRCQCGVLCRGEKRVVETRGRVGLLAFVPGHAACVRGEEIRAESKDCR